MSSVTAGDRPRLSRELAVLEKNGDFLLIDPRAPAWAVVNATGRRIASLLNGKNTVSAVAARFGREYSLAHDTALTHTLSFVDELVESGLCWTGDRQAVKPVEITASLETIYLEVTGACNLSCLHCFASGARTLDGRDGEALSTDVIRDLLRQVRDLEGDQRVVFSGGEPLLRADCLPIISEAQDAGVRIELITNGTLITRRVARALSATSATVQLSLDGATAETNDRVRGEGSFGAAVSGLEHLLEAGMAGRTALCMVPTAVNVGEISQFLDLALNAGVARAHFSHLARNGEARKNWRDLELTVDQVVEMFLLIAERAKGLKGRLRVSGDYCGQISSLVARLPMVPSIGCPVGSTFAIRPNGDVYPCTQVLGVPELQVGNITQNTLAEILHGTALQRARHVVAARVARVPQCTKCEWRHVCRTGCVGSAYGSSGDVFGEDPQCELNRRLLERLALDLARRAEEQDGACAQVR